MPNFASAYHRGVRCCASDSQVGANGSAPGPAARGFGTPTSETRMMAIAGIATRVGRMCPSGYKLHARFRSPQEPPHLLGTDRVVPKVPRSGGLPSHRPPEARGTTPARSPRPFQCRTPWYLSDDASDAVPRARGRVVRRDGHEPGVLPGSAGPLRAVERGIGGRLPRAAPRHRAAVRAGGGLVCRLPLPGRRPPRSGRRRGGRCVAPDAPRPRPPDPQPARDRRCTRRLARSVLRRHGRRARDLALRGRATRAPPC